MLLPILKNAVEKIEGVKLYYFSQSDNINSIIRKGQKRNSFGYWTKRYALGKIFETPKIYEGCPSQIMKLISSNVKATSINDDCKRGVKLTIDNNEKLHPYETNISRAYTMYNEYTALRRIHDNSALLLLLIKFEEFISSLFTLLAIKYPECYLNDKKLSYSELVKLPKDSDYKKLFVRRVVADIMKESFDEWLKRLQKHNISFESMTEDIVNFKEIYYRRNIIVHNNAIANEYYIDGVGRQNTQAEIGKRLDCNRDYIEGAFEKTQIVLYGIIYQCRKIEEDDSCLSLLDHLFELAFGHMIERDWKISKFIFSMLMHDKKVDALTKLASQINFWNSEKHLSGLDSIRQSIEQTDFSASAKKFQLAKYILLEKYDEAIHLLDELFLNEIGVAEIEEWPLFIDFRGTQYYSDFKQKHEVEFRKLIQDTES